MIFLSAQPDDYYFLWQIELQLFNFNKLGIHPNQIHVLIGFNSLRGLKQEFYDFVKSNQLAQFFIYSDNREETGYLSSIRPHLIKQHFDKYPTLNTVPIFYHDSDILFNGNPNFNCMINDENWYVSDTRSYTDSKYIIGSSNIDLFYKMCNIVGIPPDMVINNDINAGGAQYLIKNTSYEFWDKVERDSEKLFRLLTNFNVEQGEIYYLKTGKPISKYNGIQAWCADMWVLLWNAWIFNYKVKVDPLLDFCWPYDNIEMWKKKKILHYAGITRKNSSNLFSKGRYQNYPPYYEDFSLIDITSCSYPIIELINEYCQEQLNRRMDLLDVTFLIKVQIDSNVSMANLSVVTQFLHKNFKTNILVLEIDKISRVDKSKLPNSVEYIFCDNNYYLINREKCNNYASPLFESPLIVMLQQNVIISEKQIMAAIIFLRNNSSCNIYSFNGTFIYVDRLFNEMFKKLLDAELLIYNIGKFNSEMQQSNFGGIAFQNKPSFLNSILLNNSVNNLNINEIINFLESELERNNVGIIEGPLFQLPH